MTQKIKILTFSTLYPDSVRRRHGIFVETRLRHLCEHGLVESRVVAPVPWFPFTHKVFGSYSKYAKVPRKEFRHNIEVDHPRYPLIPKIGMSLTPLLMALFAYPVLTKIIRQGFDFELIDAHYFYPDGVAAALLGKWLKKPVTITARGTDLNLISKHRLPRKMIQWAAKQSAGLITVCQALKDTLVEMQIPQDKVTVLRNGVDVGFFSPSIQREELRAKLGLKGKSILSVGNLVELKGHHLVIEAIQQCKDLTLYIAGDGEERESLVELARKLQLENRVFFLGSLAQDELVEYYAAADALILASSREGWANVLLESMACGTPVVATNVGGTPEVVREPEAGLLVERTVSGLVDGIKTLFSAYPDRALTRRYAEKFSWGATTAGQEALFSEIIDRAKGQKL